MNKDELDKYPGTLKNITSGGIDNLSSLTFSLIAKLGEENESLRTENSRLKALLEELMATKP